MPSPFPLLNFHFLSLNLDEGIQEQLAPCSSIVQTFSLGTTFSQFNETTVLYILGLRFDQWQKKSITRPYFQYKFE